MERVARICTISQLFIRLLVVPWSPLVRTLQHAMSSIHRASLTGIRFDDLIPEENDVVQTAIKRLPAKEAYDRIFRIRRAFQVRL